MSYQDQEKKERLQGNTLQPFKYHNNWSSEVVRQLSYEWVSHQKNKGDNQAVNGQ